MLRTHDLPSAALWLALSAPSLWLVGCEGRGPAEGLSTAVCETCASGCGGGSSGAGVVAGASPCAGGCGAGLGVGTGGAATSDAGACGGGGGGSGGDGGATGGSGGTGGGSGGNGGGSGGNGGGSGGNGGGSGGSSTTAPDCSAPAGAQGPLQLTEVATGLMQPLLLTAPPGHDGFFLVEQGGRVWLQRGADRTLFLDVSSRVTAGGELGLLGLAFHPDYDDNGRLFVHYSEAGTNATIIEEYARAPGEPATAAPDPVGPPILRVAQPATNHKGGSIEFDPIDGLLHIGLGDGGALPAEAQNLDTLLGKLLRIDVSVTPYAIPPGNLAQGAPEIFDLGLRNPYRFNFDPCTGDRYIGDVGQNQWEEIDVAAHASGNKNWGWSVTEGLHCYSDPQCDLAAFDAPVIEYGHTGNCSVTGGHVYRGSSIPWLRGSYLYGDYCSGRIWSLRWSGGVLSDAQDLSAELGSAGQLQLSSFGRDGRFELYVVAYGGTVYRIDPEGA